jgi:hypothetical protein
MYPAPIQAVVDDSVAEIGAIPDWDGPTNPDAIWPSACSKLLAWAAATAYPINRERLHAESDATAWDGCTRWVQERFLRAAAARGSALAAAPTEPAARKDFEEQHLRALGWPDDARARAEHSQLATQAAVWLDSDATLRGYASVPYVADSDGYTHGITNDEYDAELAGVDYRRWSPSPDVPLS